jgi:hypothetical protein
LPVVRVYGTIHILLSGLDSHFTHDRIFIAISRIERSVLQIDLSAANDQQHSGDFRSRNVSQWNILCSTPAPLSGYARMFAKMTTAWHEPHFRCCLLSTALPTLPPFASVNGLERLQRRKPFHCHSFSGVVTCIVPVWCKELRNACRDISIHASVGLGTSLNIGDRIKAAIDGIRRILDIVAG